VSCQIELIQDMAEENSWMNDLLQWRVKALRGGKRKMILLHNKVVRGAISNQRTVGKLEPSISTIEPGDKVRVRAKGEIRYLLDDHGKYKGCRFIDEMYNHCGKTYPVIKLVESFYDEAKRMMCKCNNTVILEGVVCSGRQRLYSVSCDRQCFFFWHTAWLEWPE